jgi:hypothetical protein
MPIKSSVWAEVMAKVEQEAVGVHANSSHYVFKGIYFANDISKYGYTPGLPKYLHMLQVGIVNHTLHLYSFDRL